MCIKISCFIDPDGVRSRAMQHGIYYDEHSP